MDLPSPDSEIRAWWVGEPGPAPGGPGVGGLPTNPPLPRPDWGPRPQKLRNQRGPNPFLWPRLWGPLTGPPVSWHSSTRADLTEPDRPHTDLELPPQPCPHTHGLPATPPHTPRAARGLDHSLELSLLTGAPCCQETEQPEVEGSGPGTP